MKEALLYDKLKNGNVHCALCSHRCIIKPGERGKCGVRENREGTLYSLVYGRLISENIDPIEKKPLFHFLPGSRSLSIATVGCNLTCAHCQNYDISQYPHAHPGAEMPGSVRTPEEVVEAAVSTGCESISYTYTEPTIFMEFALEAAKLAHERGVKNVFVSNGFMTPEAVKLIAPYLDADNVDLKGDDEFYKTICGARAAPVRRTIQMLKDREVWVEVTTLVIPGHNDAEDMLRDIAEFVASVDPSIPWHVTAFYPTYKLLDSPRTPAATLRRAREIGFEAGLRYVYEGNVPGEGGENTYCPACKELLIERYGFSISKNNIGPGQCPKCGELQQGVFKK
jgi:pyruvate formate lyase activating enzyme